MHGSVLIIDDDAMLAAAVEAMFRHAGYRTSVAPSGRKGVERFRAAPADLVITDILMPDKDGIAVIRELKNIPNPPKIVAVSGGGRLASAVVLKWAGQLGADATLPKPFAMSDLLGLCHDLLRERELAATAQVA